MNKTADGIHTYEENRAFIEVGASALGASAGIVIVEGAPTDESRYQTYLTRAIESNDCTRSCSGQYSFLPVANRGVAGILYDDSDKVA